ncbi:MAG: LTA synthase family protein [Oscillospiraceae bacterium]
MRYCFETYFPAGILYTFLFSASLGFICFFLSSVWKGWANRVIAIVLLIILTAIFCIQTVYYTIFSTFTTVSALTHATEAISNFYKQAFDGVADSTLPLILLLIPFLLLIFCSKILFPEKPGNRKTILFCLILAVFSYGLSLGLIALNNTGLMSYRYVYFDTFSPDLSVPRFGILTTLRLDIKDLLFDIPQNSPPKIDNSDTPDDTDGDQGSLPVMNPNEDDTPPEQEPVVYTPNVLEIDFDKLIDNAPNSQIAAMHEYFSTVEPTMKNEYTGMFEGDNLIWIVAEGFSSLALDETHTPTLSKMAKEGFVFNNFYNPIWGVSTSDGEYVTTTGLIPKSGVWSYSKSGSNYMPFGFGTMFSELGYESYAYHDHTYTYYDRDTSHPNMGYDYKGVGNGLEMKNQWPESDVEMMQKTIPEYTASGDPFHVYYMTVSGHMNYNFMGNMMAYKHREEVSDLPYTEGPRAYIACQMEFDQAIGYLIDQLSEKGILDNTVIVISGDHYPYGLTVDEMQEIKGAEIEQNFELYRSTLMIWNSKMETVQVDKYCSSLDIMPTLANLFGLDYDSRLTMGRDILSDCPALVIFSNRSFITDLGRYNSKKDVFTPNEGAEIPDGYAAGILKEVNDKFSYSAKILDNDYYAAVFPDK